MGLTAGIMGGLGAVGSIGSSLIAANASKQASNQQAQSQEMALMLQAQKFQTAQNALEPYVQAGQNVLPTLQNLLTPGQSANQLAQMPGFQFQSQYGTMAAKNALSAQGLGGSGGPLAVAVSNYNQGLAGTYYQNSVNALQNYANMGSGAASSLAGNAIGSGNAMAGTAGNIGGAQASGTLGSANALSGGLSGATGALSSATLLNSLLGQGGQNANGNGIYGNIMGLGAGGVTGAPGG